MERQQDQFRVQTVAFVKRGFDALISTPGLDDAIAVSEARIRSTCYAMSQQASGLRIVQAHGTQHG